MSEARKSWKPEECWDSRCIILFRIEANWVSNFSASAVEVPLRIPLKVPLRILSHGSSYVQRLEVLFRVQGFGPIGSRSTIVRVEGCP